MYKTSKKTLWYKSSLLKTYFPWPFSTEYTWNFFRYLAPLAQRVLRISSDGDDQRLFWGFVIFDFAILGFFGWKNFPCICWMPWFKTGFFGRSSAITYNQTSFWKLFRAVTSELTLSVIFKAREFVDHPRHLKIRSNPAGCLGCSKNRPSAPPCRKQGLILRRIISYENGFVCLQKGNWDLFWNFSCH